MNRCLVELELSSLLVEGLSSPDLKHHVFEQCKEIGLDQHVRNLVLTMCMEEYNDEQRNVIDKIIEFIKRKFKNLTVILIIGNQYKRYHHHENRYLTINFKNPDAIYYVNAILYRLYRQLIQLKVCKISENYVKTDENKFLLLIGKPTYHRVNILYKLYKKGLLSNSYWKFYLHNDYVKNKCRSLLPEMTDVEFNNFVRDTEHFLDDVDKFTHYFPDSSHFAGIPFDYKIFYKSAFQLILETDFEDGMITEKTYISIANKRPFIIATSLKNNQVLRKKGFKTFEDYLPIKDYNDVYKPREVRYDEIVQNVEYWCKNIHNYYDQINQDVEHNYNNFVRLGELEEQKIIDIIKHHNLDCDPWQLIKGYFTYGES